MATPLIKIASQIPEFPCLTCWFVNRFHAINLLKHVTKHLTHSFHRVFHLEFPTFHFLPPSLGSFNTPFLYIFGHPVTISGLGVSDVSLRFGVLCSRGLSAIFFTGFGLSGPFAQGAQWIVNLVVKRHLHTAILTYRLLTTVTREISFVIANMTIHDPIS